MIKAVSAMPKIPQPFDMRNWRKTALDYDRLIFDEHAEGDFMPLIWFDEMKNGEKTFGLPSYINSRKRRAPGTQEGINCIAAVLGASLCGADKQKQNGHDYVAMLKPYFSDEDVFLNSFGQKTGGTFWYETYPNVLMSMMYDLYPQQWLYDCLLKVADQYVRVIEALGGENADFNYTSFSMSEMKPVYNGKWREPEAAAGYAFVLYTAYKRSKNPKYLSACKCAMNYLENTNDNPFYEIMLPWASLVAARLNAEEGTNYNISKLVNWCFEGDSACRKGWGVVRERWGWADCHGLCGSLVDWGQRWDMPFAENLPSYISDLSGYAFAANSFSLPAALVPIVKYNPAFARDMGRWMLNLANNARLFYPSAHSPKGQSCRFWDCDPYDCIAYEGLKKKFDEQSPYATGDPIRYAWGGIDLGLYGSSHVGLMASLIGKTSDEKILLIDCGKTDTAADRAPAYLLYNPYDEQREVTFEIGAQSAELYNIESGELVCKVENGAAKVAVKGDSALVLEVRK